MDSPKSPEEKKYKNVMSQHKGRQIGDLTVEEYEEVITVYNTNYIPMIEL